MSFLTEEPDNVNTTLAETLREIRENIEAGAYRPVARYTQSLGNPYWPTSNTASHHYTLADTKWERDLHPKD